MPFWLVKLLPFLETIKVRTRLHFFPLRFAEPGLFQAAPEEK
jgi:hypothetical protein